MFVKSRIRLLNKISQNLQVTISSPPSITISQMFPGVLKSYTPQTIKAIDNLFNLLNTALHYSSEGHINIQTLKNINFNYDVSSIADNDQKNIVLIAKKIYSTILNSGNEFDKELTPQLIKDMVDSIFQSNFINNLSSLNPTSIMAQKIGGNLKTLLTDDLNYIKIYNPVK